VRWAKYRLSEKAGPIVLFFEEGKLPYQEEVLLYYFNVVGKRSRIGYDEDDWTRYISVLPEYSASALYRVDLQAHDEAYLIDTAIFEDSLDLVVIEYERNYLFSGRTQAVLV